MTTELKDGFGNEFTVVTKDVSPSQSNSIRQNWHFATKYPVEHRSGGAFQTTMKSNIMAANATFTNLPIVSFRFVSPSLICILRALDLSMWSLGTQFTAGIASFDVFAARLFTAEASGGLVAALSGNTGKLRASHQSALSTLRVSDTVALTPGTRVLDANPFENITIGITTATNNVFLKNEPLFSENDHPLVFGNQEGFVIQGTVPPSGTWGFNLTAVWDEVEANNY